MKVLVATGLTQGERADDFNDCVEGELVWMREGCAESIYAKDKKCRCRRALLGMSSLNDTTTALVRDIPGLTRAEYEQALRANFDLLGWCSCCTTQSVGSFVDGLIAAAGVLPAGAIVERHPRGLKIRAQLADVSG